MVLAILIGTPGNVAAGTHMPQHKRSTARSIGFRSRSSAAARLCSWSARSSRTIPREDFSRVAESLEAAAHEMLVHRCRGISLAADPRFPDWPCNQIKVPEISVAAVWTGPSIDDVENAWEEDATIRDLVARLAARRTPLDDAQKAIADVITGGESERQKKAKLIFAGLF